MIQFYVGALVGLTSDPDCRGVVVDSHPDRGWKVYWTQMEYMSWHDPGELWLREEPPEPKPDYQPIESCVYERDGVRVIVATELFGPEASAAYKFAEMLACRSEPIAERDPVAEAHYACALVRALFGECRSLGWLHPMQPAGEVPDAR